MTAIKNPAPEEVAAVETALWNTIRALEAIERQAIQISMQTTDQVNAIAEGIGGIANVAIAHVRQQQITLGGAL